MDQLTGGKALGCRAKAAGLHINAGVVRIFSLYLVYSDELGRIAWRGGAKGRIEGFVGRPINDLVRQQRRADFLAVVSGDPHVEPGCNGFF